MAKKSQSQEQYTEDLNKVMGSLEGRRVVWQFLEYAGIFHACGDREAEGGRRVGLMILGDLVREVPGLYLTMQKEQLGAETFRKSEQEKQHKQEEEHVGDK